MHSRNQAKVRIGSRYTRPWFQDRTPLTYAAFRGPTSKDEDRLQAALLDRKNERRAHRASAAAQFLVWFVVAGAVFSAAYVVLPSIHGG